MRILVRCVMGQASWARTELDQIENVVGVRTRAECWIGYQSPKCIKEIRCGKVSADSQIMGASLEVGGAQACRFDEGVINDQL